MAVAVLVMALSYSACGIPSNGDATTVAPSDVPFGLAVAGPATTSPVASRAGEVVAIYLIRGDRLVAAPRRVSGQPDLDRMLRLLAEGPTDEEAAGGVRSVLVAPHLLVSSEVVRGTALVEIAPAFTALAATEQLLAIAQMVFTATERPGVGQLRLTAGGVPIEIPRGDGSLTIEPVTREDYGALRPS